MILLNSFFQLVERGELSEASFILGELLEKEPDNEDFISGYYAIKYWLNRESLLNQKTKIDSLINEWKTFEEKLKERGYKYNFIIYSIKVFITKKIANLIKNKLTKEELNKNDNLIINQIAIQLVSIGELEQAKEMLYHSKRMNPDHLETFFLLGDLYCLEAETNQDDQKLSKGLSLIRDAYLIDNKPFPIFDIHSTIIKKIIAELNFLYEEDNERIQYWLPDFIMIQSFRYYLRKLTVEEILRLEEETQRLERELASIPKKFYEKALARLIFFYLVIIHSLLYHYSDDDRLKSLLNALKELSPKIYDDITKILFEET